MDAACAQAAIKELEISPLDASADWGVLATVKTEYQSIHVYPYGFNSFRPSCFQARNFYDASNYPVVY